MIMRAHFYWVFTKVQTLMNFHVLTHFTLTIKLGIQNPRTLVPAILTSLDVNLGTI